MSEQFLSDSQINVRAPGRALRLTYSKAKQAFLEPVDLKALSDTDVLVETLFSGISRGTERIVYSGKVPESEWGRMRCPHQNGEFSFPVTYGYASVGKVILTGSGVRNTKPGDHVFVLHPHQTRFIVHSDWINVLPENLPDLQTAVLSANLETALNANWDAQSENAERIAIIGGGIVGLLTGYVAMAISGTKPVLIDINPGKEAIARNLGMDFKLSNEAAKNSSEKFDCIFNTSASQHGLQLAIDLAAFEGQIIEMSWYGDKDVTLSLGAAFHSQRLRIQSSQVGHVAPSKRKTHSYKDRMSEAMEYLKDPALKELLNPIVQFSELPQHLDEVLTSETTLCPLVTHSRADQP
ncbi:MAG: zinc-binding alcohol dehydrogenase [Rhizobiaceae bacterium]|nr:zinc-binding alcohol dehydrogenase [Rhizobiaceae bacterium]